MSGNIGKLNKLIKQVKGDEIAVKDWVNKGINSSDMIWIKALLKTYMPQIEYWEKEQIQELVNEMKWYSDIDLLNYVALKNNLDEYVSRLNEEIVTSRIDNILESK